MKKESSAKVLKLSRHKLDVIEKATSTPYIHQLVAVVVGEKTDVIKLTGFEANFGANGINTLTLRGKAGNRNGLLSFSKALEQNGVFSKVSVPISNFAESSNLDFTIFATIK